MRLASPSLVRAWIALRARNSGPPAATPLWTSVPSSLAAASHAAASLHHTIQREHAPALTVRFHALTNTQNSLDPHQKPHSLTLTQSYQHNTLHSHENSTNTHHTNMPGRSGTCYTTMPRANFSLHRHMTAPQPYPSGYKITGHNKLHKPGAESALSTRTASAAPPPRYVVLQHGTPFSQAPRHRPIQPKRHSSTDH